MPEATLGTITGQPREVDIGGQPVKLYPLTIDDIAAWDAWAQREFLRSAGLQDMPEGGSFRSAREYRDAVLEKSESICFGSLAAVGPMSSTAGMLQAVWLSLKHAPVPPGALPVSLGGAGTAIQGKSTLETLRNLQRAFCAVCIASGFMAETDQDAASAGPLALAHKVFGAMNPSPKQ
jgi:hypothetical protein